ncbi:multidrug resistance efflux transporter family protein [Kurthia senegalensis]|uniref:multidrug resistance efflux transporter family protein n=1 Tax=Kurthia senegalensis TaxID=1033740 RepID=UPI000288A6FF
MIEIVLGILAALFFAVTFILNHEMEVDGGSWLWSASLRYFCMLSFFLGIVLLQGQLKLLYNEMKKVPVAWIRWNFIRFVLFYAPLTFAAAYGAGWLASGTWQFTIVVCFLFALLFSSVRQPKNDGNVPS